MQSVFSLMNIIYIKTPTDLWLDFAKELQDSEGWNPVMWVGNRNQSDSRRLALFPESKLYEHKDAIRGLNSDVLAIDGLEAFDMEIFRQFSHYEEIIMEMMTRWFLGDDALTYEDRRQYYYNLVRLWLSIFKKTEADMIICPTIPHRIYDYIAYLVSRYLGKPFLSIEQTSDIRVGDEGMTHFHFALSDIEDRSKVFLDVMATLPKEVTLEESEERYLERARKSYEDVIPSYIQEKQVKDKKTRIRKIYEEYLRYPSRLMAHTIFNITKPNQERTRGRLFFSRRADRIDTPDFSSSIRNILREQKVAKEVSRSIKWYEKNSVTPDLRQFPAFARPDIVLVEDPST